MPKKHETERTVAARKQFARNLCAAMEDQRLTPAELARQMNLTSQTVSDWRSGRSAPGLENLIILAGKVRQSISWLCGDAFHGTDTLEHHQQDLAVRLGGERLRALSRVPDSDLLPQIDLLIRTYPTTAETDARSTNVRPIGRKRRK